MQNSKEPDALYLLDEPEVSLSPENHTVLAEKLKKLVMLGTLHAKIYNLDSRDLEEAKWTDLENVRYFFEVFERHREELRRERNRRPTEDINLRPLTIHFP